MGVLKINCYCDEPQMLMIVSAITTHLLNSDRCQVSDFDDLIGNVRVCVEFETYLDSVKIKASEILDNDWDVLYEDTAVLTSRLKTIITDFNKEEKEVHAQAKDIRRDQLAYNHY